MSKIPQGEWNAIAARYQGGESISKIARSYGCTPPAIHYILKRNRQKPSEIPMRSLGFGPATAPQTGLVRANAAESRVMSVPERDRSDTAATSPVRANTPEAPSVAAPRTENLTNVAPRNEHFANIAPHPAMAGTGADEPEPVQARAAEPAANAAALLRPIRNPSQAAPAFAGLKDVGRTPNHITAPAASAASAGLPGLDDALHLRAEAAIALFRSSFDAALAEGSPDVRERLRQAASDLMRVAARTTIVLDRLNASTERNSRAHNYPRSAHAGEDMGKYG
ncbi:MAG TPA: hypothetical protein VL985_18720 [Stellaceae bacterium]|nr:hypothetical protein [Stellaceae bacterium]